MPSAAGIAGAVSRAAFPDGVSAPVQYGPRIAGVAVYLQHAHFLPEDRLSQVMAELFGAPVTAATLAAMSERAAERLRDVASHIEDLAAGTARVKHMDETGFRIGGQTQWLHVICTPLLAAYRVSGRRGALLSGVSGIVVHDHWKPYFTMEGVAHSMCNAHHLRELQALVDIEGEAWAGRMQQLLRRAYRVARIARDGDICRTGEACCADRAPIRRDHCRGFGLPRERTAALASQAPARRDAGSDGSGTISPCGCAIRSARCSDS